VTKKAGRTIFRIGMATADIKIRNLSLSAESNSGTYGIHAVGSGTESNTTVFVGLDDVTFNGFEIGFKAETIGTGYWQFDHIDLNRTYFLENKVAGILINTPNSDWHISSSQFAVYGSSGVHPDGIVVLTAGMILVENSFAAAITGTGGEFLDVQSCAALTVIGCETEAMTHALQFGDAAGAWGSNSIVITLMNNLFGDGMDIRARSNLISTGNAYFAQNVTTIAGVKIYSTGDRFCGDAAQFTYPCVNGNSSVHTGGFGNGKIMFQTGQQRDPGQDGRYVDGTPMRIGSDVDIQVDDDYAGNAGLSVTSADHTKPLFRLGDRVGNTYSLRRNDDGLLTFSGTQAFPYRGYKFDGQIVPPSFAWAALPTTPGNGAMIYCSDCTRNATPCAGGGSGAPAVKVAGTWECK
jgi:hypothetical protein